MGSPKPDPLGNLPAFFDSIRSRLERGRIEYEDRSFIKPPSELVEEIEEELLDVAAWAFIAWQRIRAVEERLSRLEGIEG